MRPLASLHARWIYVAAVLLSAVTVSIAVYGNIVPLKDLIAPLMSIVGTFFGATFAFRLSEGKEMQKLQDTRREAMNRALFVLIRQANATHQLFREFEKYPSHFEKAFNLPALKPPLYQDLIQNLADLDFLLGSPQPGLLMDLAIEQERFHQAIECLKIRNDFYITEVQPAVAKFALNGKTVTLEETASVLGERLFGGAMNGAQIAWDHISANNVTIPAIHKRLFAQAKILFPGHHFITYEKIG